MFEDTNQRIMLAVLAATIIACFFLFRNTNMFKRTNTNVQQTATEVRETSAKVAEQAKSPFEGAKEASSQ